jgi:glutamate dehydrogenase/leucine dehydrogenase
MGAGPNGYFWREDEVNQRLEEKMVASFIELSNLCRTA